MKKLSILFIFIFSSVTAYGSDYFLSCFEVQEDFSESYYFVKVKERSGDLVMKLDYYDDDDYGVSQPLWFDYVSKVDLYNGKVISYRNDSSELRVYLTREVGDKKYEASFSSERSNISEMKMSCSFE